MENYKERLAEFIKRYNEAEYIVVGAGAGLSEAAGFHYGGERFNEIFSDFKDKYGIEDMYSGSFYEFDSEEEKWAYWARMINCNTYDTSITPIYAKILELIRNKKYFVVTTNTDNQFIINGLEDDKYFETQGNYIYLQCKRGCHKKVYYNEGLVKHMVHQTKNCRIPTPLVPVCPKCGGKMDVHVRKDRCFVETKGWDHYNNNYHKFLKEALKHKVLFLEFGIGFNTPGIIRYPFEQMVYNHKNAYLVRFNRDYPFCLKGNENNVTAFDEDILKVLSDLIDD